MKKNDICVVKATLAKGSWPGWYFAKVIDFEFDAEQDWSIYKVQVIGEMFVRDEFEFCYCILDKQKQTAAQKLAKEQWGPKGYPTIEAIKTVILAIAP